VGLRLVCRESLAEFAARTLRINSNPFFPAACTSEKTLLSLQTCPQGALQQAASPLFLKRPTAFLEN
jgi:hypothetical protein